jgi:chitinase
MRISVSWVLALVLIAALVSGETTARAGLWVTGYFPAYEQATMPASNIDFTTLTHVIHFCVVPNADGSLNSTANDISPWNSADLVTNTHAAGAKALICVGGSQSETAFQAATSASNLPVFISNLTNFMATRGYDGIDIDWEPLPSTDARQFTNFVNGLRSALNGFSSHKLLTSAVGAYPPYGDSPTAIYAMYASLQNQFDQINVMVYDLSGPYAGWVTWFNSPIYNGGYVFPGTSEFVPSLDVSVSNFLNNGVAPAKLAVSIAFYGYIWTGGTGTNVDCITGPRQSWTNAPTATAIRYSDIMTGYYASNLYHWDTNAQAAYLGITNANPVNNDFISYDDQRTCQAKVSYVRNHGLGGLMIWEIAQDHVYTQPSPLMQAVNQALATPGLISLQKSNADVNLTFNSIALGSYRVEWNSNLNSTAWKTLVVTNVAGTGAPLKIHDAGVITNQPGRFYRIQTPP